MPPGSCGSCTGGSLPYATWNPGHLRYSRTSPQNVQDLVLSRARAVIEVGGTVSRAWCRDAACMKLSKRSGAHALAMCSCASSPPVYIPCLAFKDCRRLLTSLHCSPHPYVFVPLPRCPLTRPASHARCEKISERNNMRNERSTSDEAALCSTPGDHR